MRNRGFIGGGSKGAGMSTGFETYRHGPGARGCFLGCWQGNNSTDRAEAPLTVSHVRDVRRYWCMNVVVLTWLHAQDELIAIANGCNVR